MIKNELHNFGRYLESQDSLFRFGARFGLLLEWN